MIQINTHIQKLLLQQQNFNNFNNNNNNINLLKKIIIMKKIYKLFSKIFILNFSNFL